MTDMLLSSRKVFIATIVTVFFLNITKAQPRKGEFIQASIGLGMSAPDENYDIIGTGIYAQAEYVMGLTKWFGVRPYIGFISTAPHPDGADPNLSQYQVTSKAFLIGGKARIAAPIPYVAPYLELGIGTSIGKFVTYTPTILNEKKGLVLHIPVTLGLALGRDHGVEIAFTCYIPPSLDQYSGAAAFGLSFPINR